MERYVMNIKEKEVYPLAEKRFVETCGFNLETEKHKRMMKMGLQVLEDGVQGINIQAIVSFVGKENYRNGLIEIDNQKFTCNYFKQIPEEIIEGFYFYLLTAGECYFSSEENIMDFLYADIWGTSYVDAGVRFLERNLEKDLKDRFQDKTVLLSEEFGPGYYGMPVIKSKQFYSFLEGERIGVKVKDSGLLIPQKSCAGLYFVVNDINFKMEPECLKCEGNLAGCKFCKIYTQRGAK